MTTPASRLTPHALFSFKLPGGVINPERQQAAP